MQHTLTANNGITMPDLSTPQRGTKTRKTSEKPSRTRVLPRDEFFITAKP